MITIKPEIINKYNKLFDSLVEYYEIHHALMIFSGYKARRVHHLELKKLGYHPGEYDELDNELDFLSNSGYDLILPFHEFSYLIINDKMYFIKTSLYGLMNNSIERMKIEIKQKNKG